MNDNFRLFSILLLLLSVLVTGCLPEPAQEPAITLVVPTAVSSSGGTAVAVDPVLPTPPGATSVPILPAATVTLPGDAPTSPDSPTPTLQPTSTPPPTPAAAPLTDPPTTVITSLPLPGLSRDLLFLADGALRLWRRGGGLETVLPGASGGERAFRESYLTGDISEFAVAENGRFLVASQVTFTDPLSDTVPQTFALLSLNLDSRETRILSTGDLNVRGLTLARDGQHLAYVVENAAEPTDERSFVVKVVHAGSGALRLSSPCAAPCGNLAWHPDNQNVVWADGAAGVWLYNTAGNEPQLLLPTQPAGGDATEKYGPIAWARNGRFLLLWRSVIEGGDRVVLDVPTGQVLPVPDSFVYADPHFTMVTWMEDNRLLLSRPQLGNAPPQPPLLELWRVNPDLGQLVREETDALPVIPSGIVAPTHLQDGRFGFGLYHPDNPDVNGVYILKGFGDKLDRVNAIWPAAGSWDVQVSWNPDGSGAIVSYTNDTVLYAPSGGAALYQVGPLLGRWARDFHWLPPRTN